MKGKKILALVSIFAGAALVGTTFAASAWAVTDNAPTKTIKISGEKISADTGTSYVTLEYGDSTSLADVANLVSGTKRYAGVAGLVATYTGENSYNGLLSLEMSQAARSGARLIDFVKVYVYDNAPTYDNSTKVVSAVSGDPRITLDGSAVTPVLTGSSSIAMTTGTAKPVYFVVEMITTGVDASVLNTIKSDVITVTVDWDHDPTGQDVATVVDVYYKPTGVKNDEVFCYAWKGKVPNAEYPGIKMTKESDGVYSYAINTTSFDHFILSYTATSDSENHKAREADFALTDVVGNNNYWNGTAWTTRPVADDSLTKDYYVVGTMTTTDWACDADYGMDAISEKDDGGVNAVYQITGVSLTAGDKIKVRNNSNLANEEWYDNVSTWDTCGYTLDDERNLIVSATGTYTIKLYRTSDANNHVILNKTA